MKAVPDRPNEPGDPFGSDPVDGLTGDQPGEPSPLGAAAPLPATGGKVRKERRRPKIPAKTSVIIGVVVILLLALVPAIASGLKKTPRDKVGISYGGGPIEGSHFQRIVQPGHPLFFNGLYDPLYLYPADQQNYIVSKNKNEGSTNREDSIIAPTKDQVQVEYQIATYFKLNTDELRAFHEQLGLNYNAYTNARLEGLDHEHLPPTDRERVAAGDPPVRRRRHLQQRGGAAHAPGRRAGDAEREPRSCGRRPLLLRPDVLTGRRLRRRHVRHQEGRPARRPSSRRSRRSATPRSPSSPSRTTP